MRKTLLQMVQSILSSLDGDEVNSISDTVESLQIVGFIRNSYEELVATLNIPANYSLFQLQNSTDITNPVVMYLPDNVSNVSWIKYDQSTVSNPNAGYHDIEFMPLDVFLNRMFSMGTLPGAVSSTLKLPTGNFSLYYENNKPPTYYTVISDKILLFDSYDNQMSDTLIGSKSSCFGELNPVFLEQDSFIPNLTSKEFVLLENEAKAQAFVEQKQTQNPKAEKRARNGWIRTQRDKVSVPYGINNTLTTQVNYGRQGNGTGKTLRFLRNGQ